MRWSPVGYTCRQSQTLSGHVKQKHPIPVKMFFLQIHFCSRLWQTWKQTYVFPWKFHPFALNCSISMELAIWQMTQQARWTSGSSIEVGQFLGMKSTRSDLHGIPSLWYIYFLYVQQIASCKVHWRKQSRPTTVITWV